MKNLQLPQKINSQQELDKLIRTREGGNPLDVFIQLNLGLRSSKEISFNDKGDYYIYNEIDDSEELIPHNNLMKSFIGESISKGALYKY